jgi:hypothetical protein
MDSVCEASLTIDEDMEEPITVYYELTNFIENSKDYLGSKSHKQLAGDLIGSSEAKKCSSYITNQQMGVDKSWGGYSLQPEDIASPCGLQAKLYFQDSFELINSTLEVISIRTTNLLRKFKRGPNSEKTQWVDPTVDSFEIWMTTSISSPLKKMYGIIDESLPKGNYTLRIRNRSNYSLEVGKNIVIVKERNDYGDSKLIGYLNVGGSLVLLLSILIYYICEFALRKCSKTL